MGGWYALYCRQPGNDVTRRWQLLLLAKNAFCILACSKRVRATKQIERRLFIGILNQTVRIFIAAAVKIALRQDWIFITLLMPECRVLADWAAATHRAVWLLHHMHWLHPHCCCVLCGFLHVPLCCNRMGKLVEKVISQLIVSSR